MDFIKRYYGQVGLAIILIIFICCKLSVLRTPYFLDELGVYAPGALKMKDSGTISLLPSALEPLYSRGHPLLFYFCYASVYKLFGDSIVVGHAFAVILGCITLIAIYLIAKDLFGQLTALVTAALLAAQPIFFAMSGMVLPEMLLTLFIVIAIWSLIRKNWGVYCLASALAILTKESALIIPATSLTFLFFEGIFEKDFFKVRRFAHCILAATPLFVYALFLFIQKKQNGWYFFPEHIDYIHFDYNGLKVWTGVALQDFFTNQCRWFETIFFIVALFAVFSRKNAHTIQRKTVIISLLFILFSLVFAVTNFYLTRYILYVIPVVVMIGSYGIVIALKRIPSIPLRNVFVAIMVVVGCLLNISKMDTKDFRDSSDMSYLHLVHCIQRSIDWTQQQPWRDSTIEAGFPVGPAMSDARNGYFSGKPFNYSTNYEKKAHYGLLSTLRDEPLNVWSGEKYEVIKRFDDLYAHVYVVKFTQ